MEKVMEKMKVEKYSAYKDSGIEWLGEIPEEWKVTKLRNVGVFSASGIDKYLKVNESKVKIINFTDVYANKTMTLDSSFDYMVVTTPESNRIKHLVKKGDLIFLPSSETYEDLGAAALVNEELENTSFSYHVIRLVFKKKLDHSFRKYLTNNAFVLNQFSRQGKGSTRKIIGRGVFKDVLVILPSLPEQTAIAAFLDRKTALIDQAIGIKQKQIELLKERRQILIHKAVTRGLNPNVKLKDSGVEWIGEVPEVWEVKRFKFLCDITTGSKNTEDKIENGLYPFYVRSQTPERINSYSFEGEAILTAGDGAGVGKVFHYLNEKFDFHQRVYKFSNFKNIKGKLLFYFLRNNFHNVALNGEAKSTVDSLRLPLIQNFPVPLPSILEQTQIIKHIENASTKIATAISLKEKEIEKLKEYKATLINSAVTGKLRVPSVETIKVS